MVAGIMASGNGNVNRDSRLLTREENDMVMRMLGNRCEVSLQMSTYILCEFVMFRLSAFVFCYVMQARSWPKISMAICSLS